MNHDDLAWVRGRKAALALLKVIVSGGEGGTTNLQAGVVLGSSPSAIANQSRALEHRGLIRKIKDGRRRIYLAEPRAVRLVRALATRGHSLAGYINTELNRTYMLLLLAQEGFSQPRLLRSLFSALKENYHRGNAFFLSVPVAPDLNETQAFSRLATQCGFEGVRDAFDFVDRVSERLKFGSVLLFIRGLENSSPELRRQIAGELRSWIEQPSASNRLRIVLSGGRRLAELKYADGVLSLLSSAEPLLWPDPTREDVMAWQEEVFPTTPLSTDDAQVLVDQSGGQPLLISLMLRYYECHRTVDFPPDFWARPDYSADELFTPFLAKGRQEIVQKLRDHVVGEFSLWPPDPQVRRLFWANLLKVEGTELLWRSEVVRRIGRRVLARESLG